MNKRITLILLLCSVASLNALAQISGNTVYDFLNLPSSARTAALGGTFIAVQDNDPNLGLQNPSLLNPSMSNSLSFNMASYFADVNYGYASYVKDYGKYGTFSGGVQFIRYGDFKQAEANGDITGSFTASENSINLGWGRQIDSTFSVGSTLKLINSTFQQYTSVGLAGDIAATYSIKPAGILFAAVVKNIGTQLSTYIPGDKIPLPFEIQFAISKKLKKAPLRFTITGQHLEKFDLNHGTPVDPLVGTSNNFGTAANAAPSYNTFDKIAGHIVVGAEILFSKNFHIRFGYNHLRRQELAIVDKSSTVGVSWGFGLRISKFQLSYGRATYHLAGASNVFSITTNLSDFYKRKN
jgi:hypothetical protein